MKLLVVIHETAVSCSEVLDLHQSPTFKASYHACIGRDGTIFYLVAPEEKAYAAASSIFMNTDGEEEHVNGSVDDFAYHIALESPVAVSEHDPIEAGFTEAQYKSLAWLISKTGINFDRVTTHGAIKLAQTNEPQNFFIAKLQGLWSPLKKERVLNFGSLQ